MIYLLLVGLIVSLGIRFVGTLLMGALVIIPAVSARNITRSMGGYFLVSIVFGVISALAGITISFYFGLPVGAVVVLTSILFYIISLFVNKLTLGS